MLSSVRRSLDLFLSCSSETQAAAPPAAASEPATSADAAPMGRRLHRALSEAPAPTPQAEAEATPTGAPATPAVQAEAPGAPAEGQATAVATCLPIPLDKVISPTNLGPGELVTAAQATLAAASFTPTTYAVAKAPAEASAQLPSIEAERAPSRQLRAPSARAAQRALSERADSTPVEEATPETTPEATHEATKKGRTSLKGSASLKTVQAGPCMGAAMTPSFMHPMDNQDIVVGATREVAGRQYFRTVDMFTPSRAKPLPDYKLCVGLVCGTDDIDDAIGACRSCPRNPCCHVSDAGGYLNNASLSSFGHGCLVLLL
jgi:hypothetical protein